jgi:hypothetical protein
MPKVIFSKAILLSLVYCLAFHLHATQVKKTLYINKGIFTTVDTLQFPCFAFNGTGVFNSYNELIILKTDDTLVLKVINNDTSIHGFSLQNKPLVNDLINPHDSAVHTLDFGNEGIYIFFDAYQYPKNRYMGLGGMICVSNHKHAKNFYWNIKEHQMSYSQQIDNNMPVSWQDYYPDYFTINGKSHPDLQLDTTAKVLANIGDTVRIFMANTGQAKHSIHFHGFHSRVIFSSNNYIPKTTEKETFALGSMQCVLLEMIPDKTGLYSVHDHNLVAVSGGGKHPNGMFIIMEIK